MGWVVVLWLYYCSGIFLGINFQWCITITWIVDVLIICSLHVSLVYDGSICILNKEVGDILLVAVLTHSEAVISCNVTILKLQVKLF